MPNEKTSITLCGFMSCGKSTIGRLLAKRLGYAQADTDTMLYDAAGMTLQEIFAKGGEALFRDLEYETVCRAARLERTVISTGGGVMTFARNAEVLHEKTLIVHIHRPFEDCYTYIQRRKNRPIAGQKTREQLLALYNSRLPAYDRYADFVLENTGTAGEAVERIVQALGLERMHP